MNPSIQAKLDNLDQRLEEISRLLSDPVERAVLEGRSSSRDGVMPRRCTRLLAQETPRARVEAGEVVVNPPQFDLA